MKKQDVGRKNKLKEKNELRIWKNGTTEEIRLQKELRYKTRERIRQQNGRIMHSEGSGSCGKGRRIWRKKEEMGEKKGEICCGENKI